jgi:hypothetical protein
MTPGEIKRVRPPRMERTNREEGIWKGIRKRYGAYVRAYVTADRKTGQASTLGRACWDSFLDLVSNQCTAFQQYGKDVDAGTNNSADSLACLTMSSTKVLACGGTPYGPVLAI